jgi:hypothetical protein
MSTKSTIKHGEHKSRVGFHVYFDWEDDYDSKNKMPEFIHLELNRCDFEVSSINNVNWLDVKIPIALAREIGLLNGWREDTESKEQKG